MDTERYQRGLEWLGRIDGRAGEEVMATVAAIFPDMARLLVEFPFGDVFSRPGLGLREREIATIAALTALGHAQSQLQVHVQAGLHVGLTEAEILEIILQMAVYAGFPAALNALFTAQRAFATQARQEAP